MSTKKNTLSALKPRQRTLKKPADSLYPAGEDPATRIQMQTLKTVVSKSPEGSGQVFVEFSYEEAPDIVVIEDAPSPPLAFLKAKIDGISDSDSSCSDSSTPDLNLPAII
ncbi:hypothetical protein BGX29_001200, partial [Mortierella sp. GBA35]